MLLLTAPFYFYPTCQWLSDTFITQTTKWVVDGFKLDLTSWQQERFYLTWLPTFSVFLLCKMNDVIKIWMGGVRLAVRDDYAILPCTVVIHGRLNCFVLTCSICFNPFKVASERNPPKKTLPHSRVCTQNSKYSRNGRLLLTKMT